MCILHLEKKIFYFKSMFFTSLRTFFPGTLKYCAGVLKVSIKLTKKYQGKEYNTLLIKLMHMVFIKNF